MNSLIKHIAVLIIILNVLTQFSVKAQDSIDMQNVEQNIDKYLTFFSNNNPGAVVTVMKKGDIIFNKAYGLSNIETSKEINIHQSFNLGELSKSFTSVAVLKLVEMKKLSLDDNLRQIFPDFPAYGEKIKVRNLLNHSSGLKSFNKELTNSNEEVSEFLQKQDHTLFEPGTKQEFCNSDYALLVEIIEEVSGKSYQKFLYKHIFNKLKMENTFLVGEDANNIIAESHFKEDDKYIVKKDMNYIYGGQGIYSNSLDMAKWDKALYSDKLLKCESLQQIFTVDQVGFGDKKSYYGYGWVLMEKNGVRYYWHGGAQSGYSTVILHLPDLDTTVLVLANRNDAYDFLKLSIYIAKLFNKYLEF